MLPSAHRMRRSGDFAAAVRRGRRARRGAVVVHHLPALHPDTPAVVGFVVSRTVGGSVVRHRVIRRLRHLTASRLPRLAPGSATVVRALPGAALVPGEQLGTDLAAALVAAGAAPRADVADVAVSR